jgi:hypothetical protein
MMRHIFVQLLVAKNRTEGGHFSMRRKYHPLRANSNWQVGFSHEEQGGCYVELERATL